MILSEDDIKTLNKYEIDYPNIDKDALVVDIYWLASEYLDDENKLNELQALGESIDIKNSYYNKLSQTQKETLQDYEIDIRDYDNVQDFFDFFDRMIERNQSKDLKEIRELIGPLYLKVNL